MKARTKDGIGFTLVILAITCMMLFGEPLVEIVHGWTR